MFLLGLVGIPLAYFGLLISLLVRRSPKGIGLSLLFFALAAGTAYWGITQSRSSTAALGFLGLPFIAAAGGLLGLAFGRWRSSTDPGRSVGALLALGGAVLVVGFNLREGFKTVAKNEKRDAFQEAFSAEVERDRALISAGLGQNENRQRAYLDSSIRAHSVTDHAFLIAALENDSISPGILDTLANSNDLGVALQAVRNPNTRSETLARIYRTHAIPYYFHQALAGHPHTPPDILREIYTKPRMITGLDGWFASNPATPRDVLEKIASTSKSTWALSQLPKNPVFDCQLLEQAARNLRATRSDSAASVAAQINELEPTVCAKPAPKAQTLAKRASAKKASAKKPPAKKARR